MMLAQQLGQLFRSTVEQQEVKVGSIFRIIRGGHIIETAKVLDIGPDSMGVPHVHYAVSIENAHQSSFKEKRTLGLDSFSKRFSKPVGA